MLRAARRSPDEKPGDHRYLTDIAVVIAVVIRPIAQLLMRRLIQPSCENDHRLAQSSPPDGSSN